MNNSNKTDALKQIDAIYKTVQENFNIAVYGPEIALNGLAIALIPLIEHLFSITIDPLVGALTTSKTIAFFTIRTVFYWGLFYGISKFFESQEENSTGNHLLKQKIEADNLFPLIPIATAIALLTIGQENLIAPMISVIVGSQLLQLSKFTPSVIKTMAYAQILIGILSILLTKYSIMHLWAYTVGLYGCTLIIAGLVLIYRQKNG